MSGKIFVVLLMVFCLLGCSVTVGTVSVSPGDGKNKAAADIRQKKTVSTDAQAEIPLIN